MVPPHIAKRSREDAAGTAAATEERQAERPPYNVRNQRAEVLTEFRIANCGLIRSLPFTSPSPLGFCNLCRSTPVGSIDS